MAQAEDNTQMEMELMLKEQVDPVSGNTAPLGSTPEEVRDDVPINASVGEFMINAQTVNYFGEEFFNNLQETAAEGWERIKSGEESFFRDDELEVAEVDDAPTDEVQSMAYGGTVRGYAEGDEITDEIANKEVPKPVGGGYGGYGGTGSIFTGFEMRRVKDPVTGRTKKVAFFNGRPLSKLDSYVDVSTEGETEEAAPAQAETRNRRELGYEVGPQKLKDKNVNDWKDQDFNSYATGMTTGKEGQLSNMEMGVLQTVGNLIIPGGGFALAKLANKSNADQAKVVYERTSDLIKGGANTAEILAANKASFNAAKNLEGQTFLDSIGFGSLDGSKKERMLKVLCLVVDYKKPTLPTAEGMSKGNPYGSASFSQGMAGDFAASEYLTEKPKTGSDYEGSTFTNAINTGGFKTQYDLQEALSGELGSDAQYKAAQALHSEGLKKAGKKDTSIYGPDGGESIIDTISGFFGGNDEDEDDENNTSGVNEPTP